MKSTFILLGLIIYLTIPVQSQSPAKLVAKYTFENNLENEIDNSQTGVIASQPNGILPTLENNTLRNSTVLHQYAGLPTTNSISYVQFPNPLKSTGSIGFSVSVWVYRCDSTVFDAIWSFYDENTWGTNNDHDRFYLTPNLYLSYNGPNGWFDCNWPEPNPTNIMSVGAWNLVTITADNSGFRIYLNGAKVFDITQQFAWASNVAATASDFNYTNIFQLVNTAQHFYFGFGSWWGSAELLLDNLLIYNGILTDNEILDLYTSEAVDPQWKMDADTRIEQHRKEDVTIRITQNGQAIENARIQMNMQQHEFLFGCNIFEWEENPDPEETFSYNQMFADVFNFATTRFYWSSYERVKDNPIYRYSDAVASWCNENNILVKGHPLAWNCDDPAWIKDLPDSEIYQRQMGRITDCVGRFKDKIDVWDVVNEMITYKNYESLSPRLTHVIETSGPLEFTKTAFQKARAANPDAILLINDYIADNRYVSWLNQLKGEDNQPIFDAIGVQSHTHIEGKWSNERLFNTCELLSQFDKPIHFSELTIPSTLREINWFGNNIGDASISTMAGEQYQKEEVIRYYTMLFSHPSLSGITWWDLSDKKAWRNAPAGFLREDMSPKPAYMAVKKLIKEKWATNESLISDISGETRLRAFRGKYHLKITLPDGNIVDIDSLYVIGKGQNIIEIELDNVSLHKPEAQQGNIYVQNQQMYIQGFPIGSFVEIYNLLGQRVNHLKLTNFETPVKNLSRNKLYIVKIEDKELLTIRKIIIS